MTVATVVILPAQPGSGLTEYVPLGGDGDTAPFAMYVLSNVETTMDVSGGSASIIVHMDNRYACLIDYMTLSIHQQTASVDKELAMDVIGPSGGARGGTVATQGTYESLIADFAPEIATTWTPPGMLLLPGADRVSRARFRTANDVTGDVLEGDMQVLLFNPDVRNRIPMWQILRNLSPRSAAGTP